uniref:Uncharacterized protein n=1 Tax=Panagrolaimus davidi TaxID=227884 RepID=A0A914QLF4_9BILA
MFCGTRYHHHPSIDFVPKFYRCEAKYIRLPYYLRLSFDELKFLFGHGGVIYLDIYGCILKDEKNEDVAFEKIMEYLPNIEKMRLPNVKMTEKTPHALTSMKFNSKFDGIGIRLICGEAFDAEEFIKFLNANKNAKYPFFYCGLTFCKEFNADFVQKLMEHYSTTGKYCTFKVHVDGWRDDSEEESGDESETDSNDSD